MGTYMLVLYVTLDQENAIRELFTFKGWKYRKSSIVSSSADSSSVVVQEDDPIDPGQHDTTHSSAPGSDGSQTENIPVSASTSLLKKPLQTTIIIKRRLSDSSSGQSFGQILISATPTGNIISPQQFQLPTKPIQVLPNSSSGSKVTSSSESSDGSTSWTTLAIAQALLGLPVTGQEVSSATPGEQQTTSVAMETDQSQSPSLAGSFETASKSLATTATSLSTSTVSQIAEKSTTSKSQLDVNLGTSSKTPAVPTNADQPTAEKVKDPELSEKVQTQPADTNSASEIIPSEAQSGINASNTSASTTAGSLLSEGVPSAPLSKPPEVLTSSDTPMDVLEPQLQIVGSESTSEPTSLAGMGTEALREGFASEWNKEGLGGVPPLLMAAQYLEEMSKRQKDEDTAGNQDTAGTHEKMEQEDGSGHVAEESGKEQEVKDPTKDTVQASEDMPSQDKASDPDEPEQENDFFPQSSPEPSITSEETSTPAQDVSPEQSHLGAAKSVVSEDIESVPVSTAQVQSLAVAPSESSSEGQSSPLSTQGHYQSSGTVSTFSFVTPEQSPSVSAGQNASATSSVSAGQVQLQVQSVASSVITSGVTQTKGPSVSSSAATGQVPYVTSSTQAEQNQTVTPVGTSGQVTSSSAGGGQTTSVTVATGQSELVMSFIPGQPPSVVLMPPVQDQSGRYVAPSQTPSVTVSVTEGQAPPVESTVGPQPTQNVRENVAAIEQIPSIVQTAAAEEAFLVTSPATSGQTTYVDAGKLPPLLSVSMGQTIPTVSVAQGQVSPLSSATTEQTSPVVSVSVAPGQAPSSSVTTGQSLPGTSAAPEEVTSSTSSASPGQGPTNPRTTPVSMNWGSDWLLKAWNQINPSLTGSNRPTAIAMPDTNQLSVVAQLGLQELARNLGIPPLAVLPENYKQPPQNILNVNLQLQGVPALTSSGPTIGFVEKGEKRRRREPVMTPGKVTYPCEKCGVVFYSRHGLENHGKGGEKGGKCLFICEYCGKKFTTRYYHRYKTHLMYHRKEKKFPCDQCDKTFYDAPHLEIHKRTHTGERPYVCNICGRAFIQELLLKSHFKNIHAKADREQCHLCGATLKSKNGLQAHIRIAHSEDRPYECDICKRRFKQKSFLDNHKLTHTSERSFECEICLKDFKRLKDVTQHKRRHFKQYRVFCDICNKGFYSKQTLKQHSRIHSGEKPYSCEFCDYKCAVKGNLHLHQRRMHQDRVSSQPMPTEASSSVPTSQRETTMRQVSPEGDGFYHIHDVRSLNDEAAEAYIHHSWAKTN